MVRTTVTQFCSRIPTNIYRFTYNSSGYSYRSRRHTGDTEIYNIQVSVHDVPVVFSLRWWGSVVSYSWGVSRTIQPALQYVQS